MVNLKLEIGNLKLPARPAGGETGKI